MNKLPQTPGLLRMLAESVVCLVLGAVLALASLILRPVEVVRTLPKEPVEGVVYYVPGEAGRASGGAWENKVRMALAEGGGTYVFSESDVNGWAGARFEAAEVPEGTPLAFAAGSPNFRFDGALLQIGSVNKLVSALGEVSIVAQCKGRVERSATGAWSFVPGPAYLGCLPLEKIPGALPLLIASYVGDGEASREVKDLLTRADTIALSDGALVVAMP